jgi:hypothetical protein
MSSIHSTAKKKKTKQKTKSIDLSFSDADFKLYFIITNNKNKSEGGRNFLEMTQE